MCRHSGDAVAQWGCGGLVGMWWLSRGCDGSAGDEVAQWGNMVAQQGMWWLSRGCGGSAGDVMAQWGWGSSVGMWWLNRDV
jgi:hypothetical protein